MKLLGWFFLGCFFLLMLKISIMTQLNTVNNEELLQEIKERIESPKLNKVVMTNLRVENDKLIAHLDDGRELSIPVSWFAKGGVENVTAKQLKNYEIGGGNEVFFPELNEVIGIEKFISGINAPCQ